jgi:catechol 2,3-dioxygenase-like lactoylglutathione lyase family enzyme
MIRHIASLAEIVNDVDVAVQFYRQVLGFQVNHEPGSGYATIEIPGILHFGIWDRSNAAEMTYGDREKAEEIPLGFSVGFEVDDVEDAIQEVEGKDWRIVQGRKVEPWGQMTSRFFSPSGALCEFSELPSARQITQEMVTAADEDTK